MTYTDRLRGVQTSVAVKAPVLVATTAEITLSGLQTIDGVSLSSGDRVLVKDQIDAVENGIWIASSGAWSRAIDFDGARDVVRGTQVYVVNGTINERQTYRVSTDDPVIGSSSLTFDNSSPSSADADRAEAARDEIKATRQFWDTDYIAAAQIALIRAGDYDAQDEDIVTAGLQAMHDDMMTFLVANRAEYELDAGATAAARYSGVYAVNDEIFSDDFADKLFTFGYSQCKFVFEGEGHAAFKVKNWTNRARVRTGGFETFAGIATKVPSAVFRWRQKAGYTIGPIVRNIRVLGANDFNDPIGFLVDNTNSAYWDNVAVKGLKNFGRFQENILNGGENNIEISDCGYQPTQFGGTDGLIPDDVTFSTVAGTGDTTVTASDDVFTADHVGLKFMVRGAGANGALWRGEILSRTNATTVVVDGECDVDVTGATGSFQGLIGSSTASSAIVSVDQFPTGVDLVGSYALIVGAGGARDTQDVLVSRILSQTGTSITLADEARETNSDCRVIIASSEFIGLSSDTFEAGTESANNDYQIFATRNENDQRGSDNPSASVSLVVQGGRNFDYSFGKLHGTSGAHNNFGGNMAAVVADGCSFLRMPNMQLKWGCYDEKLGIVSVVGGSSIVSVLDTTIGNDRPHPDTALFFLDPQSASNSDLKLFYSGLMDIRSADDFTDFRFGSNGSADMLFRAGPWAQKGVEKGVWSEEGSWTPIVSDASSGGNDATADTSNGRYIRQGNLVTVWANLVNIDTTGLTGTNTTFIRNLPFAVPFSAGGPPCAGTVVTEQVTFAGFVTARAVSGESAVQLKDSRSGLNEVNLNINALASGSADIVLTMSYYITGFDAIAP